MINTTIESNSAKLSLTDLHTHILPSVDDGAKSLERSLDMLRALKSRGVERVALTPHFYPANEKLYTFLERRTQAYELLLSAWDERVMPQLQLGAEVRYTPELAEMDLRQLTIGQGNYLLLELPDHDGCALLEQVVDSMLQQGITPILAHVERCRTFRENPSRLFELVQMGVLAQISAEMLIGKCDGFSVACLKNGLAQIISSDIHNLKDRCCFLDVTTSAQLAEIMSWAEGFSRAVWDNTPLPAFAINPIKKGLWGYRSI